LALFSIYGFLLCPKALAPSALILIRELCPWFWALTKHLGEKNALISIFLSSIEEPAEKPLKNFDSIQG
jgi:hypothetical protein